MAKAKRNNTARAEGNRPVLRPTDFSPPRRISDEGFREACEAFGIPDEVRDWARTYLDRLVDEFCNWMKEDERRDRRNDLKRIKNAQRRVSAARRELQGLERDGRDALRYAGSERLATMLSADWVTQHFPRDAPSMPKPIVIASGPRPPVRQSARDSMRRYEGLKHQFIRYRGSDVFKDVLQDIETGLASAVGSLKSPRGRHMLIYRHYFILNLAKFWEQIGEKVFGTRNSHFKVVSTPGSQFETFGNYIFESVGWPTDGLRNAISDAATDWLYSRKKRDRLSK